MLIYPPAIALITLAFIGRFFGHDRIVYIAVMIPTWIAALFDFMKTLPGSAQTALHLDAPIQFAAANLPLFDKNLGWLLPGGHRLCHRHDLASEPTEERSRRVTGSLAESPIDENWFNERRENQRKAA